MVLQSVLIVLLALTSLVALVMVLAVRQMTRLRLQAVQVRWIEREQVPAAIRAIVEIPAAELVQLGFVYRYSGIANKALVTPQNEPIFLDVYKHHDGHTHALVSPSPVPEPHQPCMVQLITCLSDGSNWITLNRSRHFSPGSLPQWHTFDDYLPQWTQVWQRHVQRVQAATSPICTDGLEVGRRLCQAFEDLIPHMHRQGQLVPVGASGHFRFTLMAAGRMALRALVGQMRAAATRPNHAPGATTARPAELVDGTDAATPRTQPNLDADLRAFEDQLVMQRGTPSSGAKKWLFFVLTAVLFLLVGGLWLSWTFVPIVLAVVALHEGGHYLAMKLTGFRNVSVFLSRGWAAWLRVKKPRPRRLKSYLSTLRGRCPVLPWQASRFGAVRRATGQARVG